MAAGEWWVGARKTHVRGQDTRRGCSGAHGRVHRVRPPLSLRPMQLLKTINGSMSKEWRRGSIRGQYRLSHFGNLVRGGCVAQGFVQLWRGTRQYIARFSLSPITVHGSRVTPSHPGRRLRGPRGGRILAARMLTPLRKSAMRTPEAAEVRG